MRLFVESRGNAMIRTESKGRLRRGPESRSEFDISLKTPFSLERTLQSEQCPADLWFFDKSENGWVSYMPFQNQWTKLILRQERNTIVVTCVPARRNAENIKKALFYHLSLDSDANSLMSSFHGDKYLSTVFQYCEGLRVMRDLNREYRVIEAIITQNTSVRMIKTVQRLLFLHYGDNVQIGEEIIHTYPNIERIANEKIDALKSKCKVGYRAEYLKNMSQVLLLEDTIGRLERMSTDEAKAYLMGFKGVGRKVSDLILMYGLGRGDVFPMDVWVKKAIKREYFHNSNSVSDKELYEFASEYFGNFASIINLMIFTYERRDKRQFFNYCIWR